MHRVIGVVGLCLVMFTGCAIPNYRDPIARGFIAPTPGDPWEPRSDPWYCPRPDTGNTLCMPDMENPCDIAALLDIALLNHPQTRLAWEQARAQAFAVSAAESAYYPTVTETLSIDYDDVKGGLGANAGTVSSGPGWSAFFQSDFVVSYLIMDFGGRNATVAATWYALDALNWTQNRVMQQVIFTVIQSYYNYIASKGLQQAKSDDLDNAKVDLAATEELFSNGIARYVDVLQAKANLENARLALVTADNQVRIDLGALAVAIGLPPALHVNMVIDEIEMP